MSRNEETHTPVIDRIAARAGQQVRETAGQLGETVARSAERLEDELENFEAKFDDVRHAVTDTTKEYSRTVNSYVKKNPWMAIGITAGFAFLAGMLIGRRRGD
jgi:ElaB/YqjD/DUF883 family membrane-anchored ribosome-binding protein